MDCTKGPDGLICDPGPKKEIDSANSKANIATVLGIGGGLLAAGAIVVFITAPREGGVVVGPVPMAAGAGVSVSGRF